MQISKVILVSIAALAASPCFGQADSLVVNLPSQSPKYRFDLTDTEHYKPTAISRDDGGLVLAGSNFSSQIRCCESINGIAIEQLEKLMRPGSNDDYGSTEGFLGENESLLDVLVSDNEFVMETGFTHRQLAIPLLQVSLRARRMVAPDDQRDQAFEFEHATTNWRVKVRCFRGYQLSPFNDGTKSNCEFTLTNIDNNESVEFSGLVPLMIERYGFYEGHGTRYRVDPKRIMRVLGLN